MKLEVQKGALVQVLQRIQSITDKKTNMPILANVLIKASDDRQLEFCATDLELCMWTSMEASVEHSGKVTVSARKLLDIVRELPQETVFLEDQPNYKLLVRSGRSRFELSTIPHEEFPVVTLYEDLDFHPCDVDLFRKALAKTSYAIPADDDPFSVAGLFWQPIEGEGLRLVSSDGHRLAYVQIASEAFGEFSVGEGIIIPRKGVQEILRILEKEAEAFLGLSENRLVLRTPTALLSINLLEAEFPDYQLIIPDERPFVFTVDREEFHAALKRMVILTNTRWRYVRFKIYPGQLELEAGNPEIGNAVDIVDIEYDGPDFTVAFNIKYVMDSIQAVESPQVRFEWVDQYHGGVFTGADELSQLNLIMPMVV